jgi:hypothetical protein
VPGAGHSPMVEQPTAVARLLIDLDPVIPVVKRIDILRESGKP